MLVALVPPVGPGRLCRPHERESLAVKHVVSSNTGLQRGQPVRVDPSPRRDLLDCHTGALPQRAQLLAGVGWL